MSRHVARADVLSREDVAEIQALGMKVPAALYARSPRVYRGLEELTYLFHDQTIAVSRCGRICFKGRKVTQVGERIWLVTFM
jgi:putative transposase